MSKVQSILFNKKLWSLEGSKVWLLKHDIHPIKKAHITKNFIRYRIRNPNEFNHFRIIKLNKGIEFVIGFY